MTRRIAFLFLVSLTLFVQAFPQASPPGVRPVVVQGAMRSETEKLVGRLENVSTEKVGAGHSGEARSMAILSLFRGHSRACRTRRLRRRLPSSGTILSRSSIRAQQGGTSPLFICMTSFLASAPCIWEPSRLRTDRLEQGVQRSTGPR